jgi:hypothetical protein
MMHTLTPNNCLVVYALVSTFFSPADYSFKPGSRPKPDDASWTFILFFSGLVGICVQVLPPSSALAAHHAGRIDWQEPSKSIGFS